MQLLSEAFKHNGPIPKKYSNEGDNVSPQLSWSATPAEAKSFALICHDPDAPLASVGSYGFVHWVLYNLPASVTSLEEGGAVGTAGVNDTGGSGYSGPMPPIGHGNHHYFFVLMALDEELDIEPGLTLWQLMSKIEPHVIAMNRLMGTYAR
jgi:Raf kinase inhibitor-like YbhB/YbcL family protein